MQLKHHGNNRKKEKIKKNYWSDNNKNAEIQKSQTNLINFFKKIKRTKQTKQKTIHTHESDK